MSPTFQPPRAGEGLPTVPWDSRRRRKRRIAGLLAGLTALTAAGAAVVSTCTLCYAVSDGGERPLAYVPREETYAAAVAQVEDRVSHILRQDYAYPQETTVALTIAPKKDLQDPDQLTASLMETVDQVQAAWVLTVEGIPVWACASREAVLAALEGRKGA